MNRNYSRLALTCLLTCWCTPALSQQVAAQPPALSPQEQVEMQALELRASRGNVNSAVQLADLLRQKQRHAEAERWYRYAFIQDSGRAGFALYSMHKQGLIKLTNADDIFKLSVPMMEQAAQNADASSALILGIGYLKGNYLPINYSKALSLLELSRKQGKAMASYHLGNIYSNGLFVQTQPNRALSYYKEASDKGVSDASRQLALAYLTGTYYLRNTKQAIQLFEKSIQQGSIEAMRDLANLYRYEENNMALYEQWMQKAAAAGDRDARYYIGLQLEAKSPAKAQEYFTMAANQGHFLSKQKLPKMTQLPDDDIQ